MKNELLAPLWIEQVFGVVIDQPFDQPTVSLAR
ncbi:hypothetical protein J2793_006481 [Paraburkholderia caledonica]|uniref:Uncharacterized protein n=1 Tax=Paraburkholderia caledonica TaxID=134536 RepID=A0AB73ILW1_9BURK|nr:hypothetical protein [Paraburkholderia caledonica]